MVTAAVTEAPSSEGGAGLEQSQGQEPAETEMVSATPASETEMVSATPASETGTDGKMDETTSEAEEPASETGVGQEAVEIPASTETATSKPDGSTYSGILQTASETSKEQSDISVSESQNQIPLTSGNSKQVPVITISKKLRAGESCLLKGIGSGTVVYKSSKSQIAKIVYGNLLKAGKPGNCTITATVRKNGKVKYKLKIRLQVVSKKDSSYETYSKKLTRSQKQYKGIKMLVSDTVIKKGAGQKLKITKNGYTMKYKIANKKIVKVSGNVIYGRRKGCTSITVLLKKGKNQIKYCLNIKVTK
jgi:hypothetical protein